MYEKLIMCLIMSIGSNDSLKTVNEFIGVWLG